MKKIIITLFIISLTFNTQFAFAKKVKTDKVNSQEVQTAEIVKTGMDFATAYELMMLNNNEIKAVLEEIEQKKYEKRAAVGEYLPKIGVNATTVHFDKSVDVGIPPIMGMRLPAMTLQDKNLTTLGFGAAWNIFTGGRIIAYNSAARAKLESSNLKYKSVTNKLTTELVKRYYGLKLAQDVVSVRKQVLDTTKKHLDDAIMLEDVGIIAKSERLHADVAYSQALCDYNSALRDEEIAEEGLKNLIKAEDVNLSDVKVQILSSLFLYDKELDSLSTYKERAIANNPDFKQTEVKKQLAKANYRAKAAEYSPVLSVFSYDIAASNNLSHQVPKFGVGAGVNFTLFDGLSRYNNLQAAKHLKEQVKYETLSAKNNIETLVTKTYNELLKYKEQYDSTNKSIESAEEALRTAELAFREGVGTSLSVTDAQSALSAIKIKRLNALYNYDVAFATLLSTQGNSEEISEYIKNSKEESLYIMRLGDE